MERAKKFFVFIGICFSWISFSFAEVDLSASSFSKDDVSSALGGQVLGKRVPSHHKAVMCIQTLFTVKTSAKRSAEVIQHWDDSKFGNNSDVRKLGFLSAAPSKQDFSRVSVESQKGDGWLSEQTQKALEDGSSGLFIDPTDLKKYSKSTDVNSFWQAFLFEKAQSFQGHKLQNLKIYKDSGPIQLNELWNGFISTQEGVKKTFQNILGWIQGDACLKNFSCVYYWQDSLVNDHSVYSLGVVVNSEEDMAYKLMDFQYFTSSDYYASMTFYEIFPVQDTSLIWRTDYVFSPEVESLRGIEKIAAENLFLQDVKRSNSLIINELKNKTGH